MDAECAAAIIEIYVFQNDFADRNRLHQNGQIFSSKADLLERFLQIRKKFIVISNTNQRNFYQILSQNVEREPKILFIKPKEFGKVSIQGDLISSDRAVSEIIRFVKG